MKQFNGYEEAKKEASYQGTQKIPTGAYVCKVSNVRYEETDYGDRIIVAFDVVEGEYKGFFKKQYDANTDENKKWKGTARVRVPSDDGSELDNWTKKAFARWTNAFEQSNSGYVWNWDETKWKGKLIGIIFHEVGTVIDGREITYMEVAAPCSTGDAKNGTFWEGYLRFKARDGYTGKMKDSESNPAKSDDFMTVPEGAEEEIPF